MRTSSPVLTWILLAMMVLLMGQAVDQASSPTTSTGPETAARPCPEESPCPPNAIRCLCDGNGRLEVLQFDTQGGTHLDFQVTYTYDPRGNRVGESFDFGADGEVDRLITTEYDEAGLARLQDTDLDANGTVDQRRTYTYNAQGNRITESLDLAADGQVDQEYQYNPPCPPPYDGCIVQFAGPSD